MGTLYDELAASEPPARTPAGSGLYDDLAGEEQQQRALRATVTATASTTPERAAQLNHLSRTTGVPRAVVETAEGEVKARAQFQELWDASADSPVLRARLMNQQFTELAKDDVSTLAAIERGVGHTARYVMGADGKGGLVNDLKLGIFNRGAAASAGAFRGVAEVLALPFDFLEPVEAIGGNPLRRVAEGFDMIAQHNDRIIQRESSQVPDALATNTPVELKIADVLTVAPGTGVEQVLAQNMRATPDALTSLEAAEAGQQAQQMIAQEAQRVIEQAANAVQASAAAELVKAQILQELTTAGRFSAEVNDAYATLVRDFYTVLGQRLGINAQQAFEQHRLRIVAQTPAGARLEQDVPLRQPGDARVDETTGLPLNNDGTVTVYHHTSAEKAAEIRRTGVLKSAGEPDLYFTTTPETSTGYGDTAVPVRVKPERLQLDDEFPDGRQDYRVAAPQRARRIKFRDDAEGVLYQRATPPAGLAIQSTDPNGFPEFAGAGGLYIGFAQPTERLEFIPGSDTEQMLNMVIMQGDQMVGSADLLFENGQLRTLYDIVLEPETRGQGVGAAVIQALLASNPGAKLGISNIVEQARGFWESVGIPQQNLGAGEAYDGTIDWQTFAGSRAGRRAAAARADAGRGAHASGAGGAGGTGTDQGTAGAAGPGVLNQGGPQFVQVTRGSFDPTTNTMALLTAADLSTFLHESGHFFLEVLADVAAQPGAPADVQADMAALLKWFGVSDLAAWNAMALDEKRPHHERFAESFEQYLLEGKAPNRELRPLFRRFRAYLARVYRSLQAFAAGRGLELSDDVRRVMDRLLATDEQIAEAQRLAGMEPDLDATDAAVERLQARSVRDLKWAVNARSKVIKKLQQQAKAAREALEAEVRAEVEAMPEVRAKAALDELRKSTPEYKAALAAWKAQRQAVLDEATTQIADALLASEGAELKGLKKGQFLAKNKRRIANEAEARALAWERGDPKPERQIVGSDVEVATLADSFGYPSVEAMLAAIDAFGRKDDAIEGLTDQRMLERHGDLVDQQAIEQAATEAVHNEARARALATELAAQRELLTNRRATGQTNAAGRPVTVNATLEAARQFAAELASRKKAKDLKAAAWAHLQAERRAAKAWEAATAKGDTQAAVQAKQDQLLNHEVYRALTEARAKIDSANAFFAKILKGSTEKLVERGLDPDVVSASRAILAAYGLAPRLGKSALEYLELVQKNDPEMYAVLRPAVEAALSGAKPYDELTVGEIDALVAELEAMQLLARRSRQMEVDGNLLDIEEAADQLKARMQEIGVPTEVPGESGAITPKQERVRWLQFAKALARRIEQWAEGMDGGRGPFTKLVFGPVKAAADRYRADRATYRREYQRLLDNLAPALRKGPIAAPELGYTFGQGHNGIGHAELLHAILHTGNESNKRKLLLGRKWATELEDGTLDTSRWDAFVERMQREGILAKAHYDFAQGVWDLLERTKPLAQKAHRDVFGRYFAEVTADAFETPYGAYRGGYVPAQADPRIVTDAALRKLAEMENENMAFSFPATSKGFTKSRTEYNRPLILDLRTIGQCLQRADGVLHC